MKISIPLTRFTRLLTLTLAAGIGGSLSANLGAMAQAKGAEKLESAQRTFATPEDAQKALQNAAESKDRAALLEIFGPLYEQLSTGDKVQDANNAQKFAAAMAEGCKPVKEGEDKITFEVGTNEWPLPVPLVKTGGQWRFDTAAGQEEIMNRHIGKDELHAIGVSRAYVTAQRQYAAMNSGAYAQKFKSAPGMKDGLYWPTADNEKASPFGPLVAEAHAEGYAAHKGAGPHPFHGYYFRILTRQGKAAPGGKMDYVNHGSLTGGFALVAYPEHWGQSGIMTFIVNQDGKVYQRDLGENTGRLGQSMKEYNPDDTWTLVQDEGVSGVVMEK